MAGKSLIRGEQVKDESIDSVDIASGSIKAGELNPQAISGQTLITEPDSDADRLLVWDATDSSLKQAAPTNLFVESGTALGIGTGTDGPDNTLHVKSPGTTHIKIESEAGYEAALKMNAGATSTYVWTPGNTSDIRFYAGSADRMHIDNDGNIGIGTTTPDNLLTVVGGHISSDGGVKSGTVHFSWSARTTSFAAGTADLVSYISFGNNSVWGWVEVTLTDDHIGTQTTGKYTKRYQIGRNIDQDHVGHQSFEVPANIGSVVNQWNLGPFEVDSNDLRIPIHRLTTLQNSVTVFVEGQLHVASLDTVDNVLNSLSLSTPAVVSNSATRDYYSIMSDRVGIGTTDPGYNLHVAGAASAVVLIDGAAGTDSYLRFGQAGTLKSYIKQGSGGNLVMTNQTADKDIIFNIKDNATEREGLRLNGDVAEVVINEGSDSLVDFRVESDSNTHMLFVDGENDKVGIGEDAPNSTLEINGSLATIVVSKTADYTLTGADFTVLIDASNADRTLTLPAVSTSIGRIYVIKRTDQGGDTVTITRAGSDTIDGQATITIDGGDSVTLQSAGNNSWIIIGEYRAPLP